ncbi:MAG: ribonuclease H-like domain-containing protein [Methanocorpusculum sp.]|uniref:ribonuclease H-like domain-containing protein n=1 Tax=Methanocorpusculum sp. TaxID=2058474 RepID=UPI002B2184CB|nr:ribonuclease H-like domain-containing protein [Methanocorpusculum sp.]MEA5087060.1 ribonuclease H-like domain-containing protein [Methanocorpusculum sp.]
MQVLSKAFTPGIFLKTETSKRCPGGLPGTVEMDTPDGVCLAKETVWPCPEYRISEDTIRNRCMQEMTLIPGIGPARADVLRKKGSRHLTDLGHTVWRDSAYEIADVIQNGSPSEIFGIFQDAHRGNDPLLLGFSHALPGEELLYFDIETLGMFQSPIILFGCGFRKGTELTVVQYLLRDIEDEPAALSLTARLFKEHSHVVTYNGKGFDVPYLNNRLSYYGERTVHPDLHFDLLYPTRRLYRSALSDCCLGTVETYILKKPRADDLPGYLVPAYYQQYLRTRDVSNLTPIIEHNELDVANLALLLCTECEAVYG